MENASKALIMAAEILVGIMIISIGVYLFNKYAIFSKERYQKIEDVQVAQFNNQFLKYTGYRTVKVSSTSSKKIPVAVTIHDIVGLANLAKMYNEQNELTMADYNNNTAYIRVDAQIKDGDVLKSKEYLEQEEDFNKIIKDNDLIIDTTSGVAKTKSRYFKCNGYQTDNETKKVKYISFIPFSDNDYKYLEKYNNR